LKIAIGSDHAGLNLKREIIGLLEEMSVEVEDFGCATTQAVDYPDVAYLVAVAIARGAFDRGILICGTGIGMSMTANKVKGVRAALCHDTFSAHSSLEHNNANVLCMGERVIGVGAAMDVVRTWVEARFGGEERHVRRVEKITRLGNEQ
jgi:ribose 5-phosphate isomerase B